MFDEINPWLLVSTFVGIAITTLYILWQRSRSSSLRSLNSAANTIKIKLPTPIATPDTSSANLADQSKALDGEQNSGFPITILYMSQTGTAAEFSRRLATEGKKHQFNPKIHDVEKYFKDNIADFSKETMIIWVVATYGEGDPPESAKDFWKWMSSDDRPAKFLSGCKYTVFGLGNKTYEFYNQMAKNVDARMAALGAQSVFPRGEGDDDAHLEGDYQAWRKGLWPVLKKYFAISIESSASSASLTMASPEYRYVLREYPKGTPQVPRFGKPAKVEEATVYDLKNPLMARVVVNRDLHTTHSDRICRHIEFDIGNHLTYEAGDHLGVYPENSKALVDAIAERLKLDLDQVVSLEAIDGSSAPLLGPSTVGIILRDMCDLTTPPRQPFLRFLADYCKADKERDTLLALSNDNEEYKKTIKEHHRSVGEVLTMFPSVQPPLGPFLETIPRLAPRYYSIASSQSATPNRVAACVGVLQFSTLSGRLHHGVCSTWLKLLENETTGALVPIYIRRSSFKLPKDPSAPIIMVGPGTGFAPFRGFLQERERQGAKENILFFGSRNKGQDWIYQEEMEKWVADGTLKLYTAFSRDQAAKDYVQHRISENAEYISSLLLNPATHFYICGDARRMPHDVHEALVNTLAKVGKTEAEAKEILQKMQDDNRYQKDTWF